MSLRYKGGVISATPPTTSTSAASGSWTLQQQLQAIAAGLWPSPPTYIEEVFSTYLYTGNGSTQTITNGIDLSGKGGMTWIKSRSNARNHILFDTDRGATQRLFSNLTSAQSQDTQSLTSFNSNGFSVGSDSDSNASAWTYVSWTFRKQPKFFDVVTYTGNGANRTISHNLGSVPGCIIVKRTDSSADWQVYHRSSGNNKYLVLNSTGDEITSSTRWNDTTPTSTVFSLGTDTTVNANGGTYVAYLFAHDAGGFGAAGTDNVITCGGYTGNGSATGPTITLGYEPQWLLIKNSGNSPFSWQIIDNMRGMPVGSADATLQADSSSAESSVDYVTPTATGFQITSSSGQVNGNGNSHIYIAIRRGPMRTPTTGTSVFAPVTYTGDGTNTLDITAGFPVDMFLNSLTNVAEERLLKDRLRGGGVTLSVTETTAESTSYTIGFDSNTQILNMPSSFYSQNGVPYVDWFFRRAPGFFDVVCYTGTGSNTTQTHNLSVVPELIIVKRRNTTGAWDTYSAALSNTEYLVVNTTAAKATGATRWNSTTPTSTVFSLGTSTTTNASASTYVAYLFATCPGVSKVGSYTGTGTTLQVNCGFTGGARFVLIKRTDSTGDWYLWDSARGIVAGNDPYIVLNTQSAQVTNTDYIDTYSAGFEISSTAPAAINANGGTFIFLAIA